MRRFALPVVLGPVLGLISFAGTSGCHDEVPQRSMPGGILSGSEYERTRSQHLAAMTERAAAESPKPVVPAAPTTLHAAPTTVPASTPAAPAAAPAAPAVTPAAAPAQ